MNEWNELPLFRPVRISTQTDTSPPRNLLAQTTTTQEAMITPEVQAFEMSMACSVVEVPALAKWLEPRIRPAQLKLGPPMMRSLISSNRLQLDVQVEGWRFATPGMEQASQCDLKPEPVAFTLEEMLTPKAAKPTRQTPPADVVLLKERLLTLLQPPLENLFAGFSSVPVPRLSQVDADNRCKSPASGSPSGSPTKARGTTP